MTTPLVLASGQLLDQRFWGPCVAALGPGQPVIFADHTRDDTIEGMAERLLSAAPARFSLCAHAMGGFVAFAVMRRAPERVICLALLSTLAPADGPAQTERREGYIRLVESGHFAAVAEERIPLLLSPGRRGDPPLLALVRAMAADTGPAVFLRQQRAIMGRADSRPRLAEIRAPTLVLWGEADGIVTRAHQDEIRAGIPQARFVALPGCGHLCALEQPAAVSAALADWLGDR